MKFEQNTYKPDSTWVDLDEAMELRETGAELPHNRRGRLESRHFARIQRKIHRFLHEVMKTPEIHSYHLKPPAGYENRNRDEFIIEHPTAVASVVGQTPWVQKVDQWKRSGAPMDENSFEAVYVALDGHLPPCTKIRHIPQSKTITNDMVFDMVLKTLQSGNICVIPGGHAFADEHRGNMFSEAAARIGGCPEIAPNCVESNNFLQSEEFAKKNIHLKVGVDGFGRDVLCEIKSLYEHFLDHNRKRSNTYRAPPTLYVSDNKHLGTVFCEDLYFPTGMLHRKLEDLMDKDANASLQQDGEPLDSPWILWGLAGTSTSVHTEPHNSCVWVHLFRGTKRWGVKVKDAHGEWQWQQFDQAAGETVFLPPGLEHQVVNVQDSSEHVAIARNFILKTAD